MSLMSFKKVLSKTWINGTGSAGLCSKMYKKKQQPYKTWIFKRTNLKLTGFAASAFIFLSQFPKDPFFINQINAAVYELDMTSASSCLLTDVLTR